MRRFARWRMRRCKARALYARQQYVNAAVPCVHCAMSDWERVDARAWRRYAFWAKFAHTPE